MASSASKASKDTAQMTPPHTSEDHESIGGEQDGDENTKASKDTDKVSAAKIDDPMEAFEDEPESDAADPDLHQRRHQLRRKEAKGGVEMAGIEQEVIGGKEEQQEHGARPRSEENEKPLGNVKKHPLDAEAYINGEEATRKPPATTTPAKTKPKLKLPKPAPNSNKKPRPKLKLPKPPSNRKLSSSGGSSEDESSGYGSNMDRLAAIPALFSPNKSPTTTKDTKSPVSPPTAPMTSQDLEICRRLDEEYERALEEREIGYNARYNSVRQSAGFSIAFMVTYMTLGTIFFTKVAGWELHQALFFAIYTITTVGFGSYRLPDSVGFQIYTIFYIFVGIATLTIVVAQVYQCIALEASRAQHSRDKAELLRRSRDVVISAANSRESSHHGSDAGLVMEMPDLSPHRMTCVDKLFHSIDECKRFLRDTEFGRGVSVLFPFAGLIAIGAMVIGPIEGWSVVQSLYFSVVALTTVGYGDFVPTKRASIYFSICWLPFSVGFMSMFLGNIAAFYIRLSDKNIQRIERQMRRRMKRAKDKAEKERAEVLRRALRGQEPEGDETEEGGSGLDEERPPSTLDLQARNRRSQVGFESLPSGDDKDEESVFALDDATERIGIGQQRRARVLANSIYAAGADDGGASQVQTMTTMRNILKTVHRNMAKGDFSYDVEGDPEKNEFLSMRSTTTLAASSGGFRRHSLMERKPSFALRVLVQERMARIIATDVAGFQSNIELNENTLSVTIDTLPDMADKWLLPSRARKAFRAVAFEVLYFVGEHSLITRGADALFDLTPFEFHGLFSPLLAAMGDADTMEQWLASTDMLASVDLKREGVLDGPGSDVARRQPGEARGSEDAARGVASKAGGDVKRGEIC